MAEVRVLLSDFQYLTREGLINLIDRNEDFDLVGVVEGHGDLMSGILETKPDVLIMDYERQDPVLISLLRKIVDSSATNVLIITNESNREHIQNLLDMGIRGIVTKSCSKPEIVNAIHSLSRNNRFFCNKVLDTVISVDDEKNGVNCDPTSLSPREYEVLSLITKGYKTAEIAEKLHVSVHTINSHRKNILRKLNLKSPAELIVYAMESGLVKV